MDEVDKLFPDEQICTIVVVCYALPWDHHGTAWEHLAEELFEDEEVEFWREDKEAVLWDLSPIRGQYIALLCWLRVLLTRSS